MPDNLDFAKSLDDILQVDTNTANIATNVTNIATNAGNISTNTTDIATNTGDIATNTADIATNAGNISTNTTNIGTNTSSIGTINTAIANYVGLVMGSQRLEWAAVVPAAGTWSTGDIVFDSTGVTLGWQCTSGGTPGTWEAISTGATGATLPNTYLADDYATIQDCYDQIVTDGVSSAKILLGEATYPYHGAGPVLQALIVDAGDEVEVEIVGVSKETSIIQGIRLNGTNANRMKNFTIRNCEISTDTSLDGSVLFYGAFADNLLIENCNFTSNQAQPLITLAGDASNKMNRAVVRNCTLSLTGTNGTQVFVVDYVDDLFIENNTIAFGPNAGTASYMLQIRNCARPSIDNNRALNSNSSSTTTHGFLYVNTLTDVVITNNRCISVSGALMAPVVVDNTIGLVFSNNIIRNTAATNGILALFRAHNGNGWDFKNFVIANNEFYELGTAHALVIFDASATRACENGTVSGNLCVSTTWNIAATNSSSRLENLDKVTVIGNTFLRGGTGGIANIAAHGGGAIIGATGSGLNVEDTL